METRILGRIGYLARAALYASVAWFSFAAVWRADPRHAKGLDEAQRIWLDGPWGRSALVLFAAGVLAHALWRGRQALDDIDGHGRGWRGLLIRSGEALVGVFYAGLFYQALALLARRARDDDDRSRMVTLLAHPLFRLALAAVGVGLLVFAIVEAVRAWRASFLRDFPAGSLRGGWRRAVVLAGRVGLVARGTLFGFAGVFLLRSTERASADTIGVGDVLRRVAEARFGTAVVGAIAVGLSAYAGLMLAEARWRRLSSPRDERRRR